MNLTAASFSRSSSSVLGAISLVQTIPEESCKVSRLISKLNFKLLRIFSRNKSTSKDLLHRSMKEEAVECTTQLVEAHSTQPLSNKRMTSSRNSLMSRPYSTTTSQMQRFPTPGILTLQIILLRIST